MWKNKVIWTEGAFLQTQHFQQQERYFEGLINQRVGNLHNFDWGFTKLQLDPAALAHGQLQLVAAEGILPDGTAFNIPDHDPPPAAITIDPDLKDCVVYLGIPLERPGLASASSIQPDRLTLHRFIVHVTDLADSNEGFNERVAVEIGRLNLRLIPDTEEAGAFAKIGVARVVERKPDGPVVLDSTYIPPVLAVNASPVLRSWLRELGGLMHQRSEVIAQRLTQPGRGGMGEIAEFLMLQIVNRYDALLSHLAGIPTLHPERLYSICLEVAGELASFSGARRLNKSLRAYNHDDLAASFRPVIDQMQLALSMVMEQTAVQIPLHDRQYGVRVAVFNDKRLIQAASFVLAVHAQLPAEAVRVRFPTQVKIAAAEKLRELVELALPGIALRALPVAPRQIPYHAGFNYFELDTGSELWRQLIHSGGLAMHIAGEFPGLELELWAIRA